MKRILTLLHDLDVSSNEYTSSKTFLRVIDLLFENDLFLEQLFKQVFGEYLIREWSFTECPYKYNDLVWFLSKNELKDPDCECPLHILRCSKTLNNANLNNYISQTITPFSMYGWQDLNPDIDVLNLFGIDKKLNTYIKRIMKLHSDDQQYHKYGRLNYDNMQSKYYIDSKIAKTDFSNLNPQRETGFFPYRTYKLKKIENDAITSGIARRYDNGLLEIDLTFRLSYQGFIETDAEYNISSDILSCNNLSLKDLNNDAYFFSLTDKDIFYINNANSKHCAEIGETIQGNRNDYVNVYSAKLDFAQGTTYRFNNTDYMVFCSNMMNLDKNVENQAISPSPNSIIFTLKTTDSVIAILVTYPCMSNLSKQGYNALNNGLVSNSFHCHIVGQCNKL